MSTAEKRAWLKSMSMGQKQAWFALAIVVLSLAVILATTPLLGFRRAQGGLGFLGILGLGPLLFRRWRGVVASDERDDVIRLRSWVVAYSIFWVAFVLTCVTAHLTFGSNGFVPVYIVQISPFYGFMLVVGVAALVSLLQYGWGGSDDVE